jgi:hypothetical protein
MPAPPRMSPQASDHIPSKFRRQQVLLPRYPCRVVESRLSHGKLQVLVQWFGFPDESTNWIDVEEFKQLYPSFHLRFGIVYRRGGGVGAGV